MTKTIDTLVQDIYKVMDGGFSVTPELTADLASKLESRLTEDRSGGYLRLSQISHPCDRKIWFDINQPELAEPLLPKTKIKFMYGDIIEQQVLFLAKVAGHSVLGEQDELDLYGIKGHRDAVIDGVTVDVKSASAFSFNKFLSGLTPRSDGFGYLGQLDSYIEASANDALVTDHSHGHFLAVDKQSGELCLDTHERLNIDWRTRIFDIQHTVEQSKPPARAFATVPDGASGNQKLDTICSYCAHKHSCWLGLRTFLYSNGPRYLTRTVRVPDVPELHSR